jgi:hypothetical protein
MSDNIRVYFSARPIAYALQRIVNHLFARRRPVDVPWYNTNRASAAPLVVFVLLFASFFASQGLLTTCGKRLAGCSGLAGDNVGKLARRDRNDVLAVAFAPIAPAPRSPTDTAAVRKKKESDTAQQTALKIAVTRLDRRFLWAFFAGLNALLAVACVVAAALLARAAAPLAKLGAGGRAALVTLASIVVLIVAWRVFGAADMPVMMPILSATLARDPRLGMPQAGAVMSFLNSLSLAGSVALVIGIWMLLRPRAAEQGRPARATDRDDLFARLAALEQCSAYLRLFLYVGTASLVVGVFRMNATIAWTQSFLLPGDESILDPLRVTMVTVIGAFYSLVLASLYIPSVLILRARARGVIQDATVPAEVKAEASGKLDVYSNYSTVLPRIVALLGPLLAGPIGELMARAAT